MASEVAKPDYSYQWSSGGSLVAPSNVKIQTGWTAEVPPFQWENWSQNRQDNAILHLFQKGISEWDTVSNYYFTTSGTRSFVQGSDGTIYVAVADSLNQDPVTDTTNTYWKPAFKNQSGVEVYALDTGTANTYKAAYSPVVKTLIDGMVLKFKALNGNTTTSTFTPSDGVIAPAAIVGHDHLPLPSGVIVTNGDVWVQWNTSVGGGSWVLINSTGGNANSGRLLNTQIFPTAGSFTYTPTPGTRFIVVEAQGAGGGGSGTPATSGSTTAQGANGASGAYSKLRIDSGFDGLSVIVGAGGSTGAGVVGGGGGSSSFGSLLSAAGGGGGTYAGPTTATNYLTVIPTQAALPTLGNLNIRGSLPMINFTINSQGQTAARAQAMFGETFGAGGQGATAPLSSAALAGSAGRGGLVIISEYA